MNDDPNYREVEIMELSELIKLQRILRRIKHLKEIEGLPPEHARKEVPFTGLAGANPAELQKGHLANT